ncbi:glycosyltransferase family 9 protein [Pseudofrankia asymbiotica]|uniref:Glycosyl transferase n=1 Tax=Pseudofrankia asymbiotica TaxID=1834516 RepID=A0A1V2I1N0_9ACTN|nr:glycosyltransferase family 9 protein [Pseudofrankia asymbiotica]ONH23660.1 glycosyl transferase [Pseudofrankia asymbiotica]
MTVVVLRALGLGDLLTGLPALRGLRRALPDRRIVLAAPRWLEPVALLSGAVDAVIPTVPLAVPAVRAPELAVNLHGRGPESTAALRATGPHRLWAFELPDGPRYLPAAGEADAYRLDGVASATQDDDPMQDDHARADGGPEADDGPSPHQVEHESRRWCRLLAWYGVPCDADDLGLPRPVRPASAPADLADGLTGRRDGWVIVHPGGATQARRWPPERWAAVARELAAGGWPVVITGGAEEAALARYVARLAGLEDSSVLAGRTDLLGLCGLVADAALLLAADTGIGHLATAYETPSVLLFGPVSPAEWGPPARRPTHRSLWSGRLGDPRSVTPDPGLLTLTVDDVLRAAEDVLACRDVVGR